MTYKLSIWYANSHDDKPQVRRHLSPYEVELNVRPEVGFLNDLLSLEGQGVRRLCVEAEE